MGTKIKICGLVREQDAYIVNENKVEFAGMVLFYPQSRRFISVEKAVQLKKILDRSIQTVAVTVSPDWEQICRIEQAGFHYIQIHGPVAKDLISRCPIPVFRAFNMDGKSKAYEKETKNPKVAGVVLDGKIPGNGEAFDWSYLNQFDRCGKALMLAGGLTEENVLEGIHKVRPDIVDVSSGVEAVGGVGKDKDKVKKFVNTVREYQD